MLLQFQHLGIETIGFPSMLCSERNIGYSHKSLLPGFYPSVFEITVIYCHLPCRYRTKPEIAEENQPMGIAQAQPMRPIPSHRLSAYPANTRIPRSHRLINIDITLSPAPRSVVAKTNINANIGKNGQNTRIYAVPRSITPASSTKRPMSCGPSA